MKKILLLLILPFTLLFASIGKITIVSGDVTLSKNGKEQKAASGTLLDEKDQVITKTGSTAQLIFNDGTAISLGAKSTFKVEEYLFDEKNSNVNAKFKLSEGAFRAITGKIGKISPDKFKLDTRTATIGIRGTRFLGIVPPNAPETIACTKGAITVTITPPKVPTVPGQAPAPAPAPQTVNVQAGQVTTVTTTSVAAPKAYTPADIKKLESAAGGDVKKSDSSQATPASSATTSSSSQSSSTTTTSQSSTTTTTSSASLSAVPASSAALPTVTAPVVATPPVAQIVQSVTNTVASTTQAVSQAQTQTQEAANVIYGVAFGGTSNYSGTGTFSNTIVNGVTTYQNSWSDTTNSISNAININSSTFDGTTFKWSGSGNSMDATEKVSYSYTSGSTTPVTPTYSYTLNSITPTTKSFTYTLPSPAPTPSSTYTGYYDNIISATPYTSTSTPTICTGVTNCAYTGSGASSGFLADSKQETVFFYDLSSSYTSNVTYTDTTQTSGTSTSSGTDIGKFSFTGTPTVAKNFFVNNSSAVGNIYGYLDFEQVLNLNQAPSMPTTNTTIDNAYLQNLFLNMGYATATGGTSYVYTPFTTNGAEIMFGNQGYYYGPSGFYSGNGGYYANSPYMIQTSGYGNYNFYTDGYSTPFMVARVFADRASLLNVQLGSVVMATTTVDANGNLIASARNITARYTSDSSFAHSSDIAVTANLYGSEAQGMAGSITDPTSGITQSFASMRTPSPLNNSYDSSGNLISTYKDRTGIENLVGYSFPLISSPSSTTVPRDPDLTLMGMSTTVNHDKGLVSAKMGYGTNMQYTLGSDTDVTQSAYIHNNLFAAASKDGKAYMYAFDTQNATDYVSWGYWAVDTGSDGSSVMPFSVWVAGVPTPTAVLDSLKASNTSYTYNGQLRGVMQDTTAGKVYSLDGAQSNINFTVNYGSGTITNGNINAVSQAGIITSSLAGTMDNVNNIIQASGTTGTAGAQIQGKIYGPSALQAGGVFKALDTARNLQAGGAFKAIKQ